MAAILLIAVALGATGCSRKATLMQDNGDTTAVAAPLTAELREAQEAWTDPANGEKAAALTHQALAADLEGRPPDTWSGRAGELLDSLGVGGEMAGDPCVLVLNLFSRSDPSSGSWPALYYCDGPHVRMQPLEGKNLKLVGASLIPADTARTATRRVAALFSRTRNGRPEPLVYVWARRPRASKWTIATTLGPDSLGGYGSAELAQRDSTIEVTAKTWRPSRGWEECAACPHVTTLQRFEWSVDSFRRVESRDEPSSYATLVRFVDELSHGVPEASARVHDPALVDVAQSFEWGRPKGTWRLAPASEPSSTELTVFRGQQEAYRVTFVPEGDDWLIASIQSIQRSVE